MLEILLIIYVLLILIGYSSRKKGGNPLLYIFTILIFTIILVLFDPDYSMDLYRYYKMLEKYQVNGIKYAVSQYYFKFAPLYPIFFYCVSRFGIPKLLIAVTSVVSYGITFYLFLIICKKCTLSKTAVFFGYLSIILFIDLVAVTGIRQNIGAILAMIGCYRLMNKNKLMGYFYILIASLIHHIFWVVLASALILSLLKSTVAVSMICCLIPLFIMCVLSGMIPLGTWCLKLYSKTEYGFLYALGHQIISYSTRADKNPTTNIIYMISSIVRSLLLLYDSRNRSEEEYRYSLIPLMIMMIGIGLFKIPTADIRFFVVANIIGLPILWKYFNKWIFSQDISGVNKHITRSNDRKNSIVALGIAGSIFLQFIYVFYGQYTILGSVFFKKIGLF